LDGDVLLFSGRTPASLLIRLFTLSRYSHVGVALWWERRLMAVEAVGSGVRAWPLSDCVRHYEGRIGLYRTSPQVRERLDTGRIRDEATGYLGRRYAWWRLFRLAWYILVGKRPTGADSKKTPPEFICSSLVSRCYRIAGVDLVPRVPDDFTTPAEIGCSEALTPVGVLEPDPASGSSPQQSHSLHGATKR